MDTRSKCVEVVTKYPIGVFPDTVTLTFEDCTTPAGHTITGQIILAITGPMNVPGSEDTSTFVDFYMDGVQVSGTKSVTLVNNDGDRACDNKAILTLPNGGIKESILEESETLTLSYLAYYLMTYIEFSA